MNKEIFPPLRQPGKAHMEQSFTEIEDLFHSTPTEVHTYDRRKTFLPYAEPPTIDWLLVQKIWGTSVHERLIPASEIAHISVFAVPAFIDAIDARFSEGKSSLMRNPRFSEETFAYDVNSFYVSLSTALPITSTKSFPEELRFGLSGFHPLTCSDGEYIGTTRSSLAFSVYEIIRIGEELSAFKQKYIHDKEKETHYQYIAHIIRDSGIWMPQSRKEMEILSHRIDALAKLKPIHPSTKELCERTIRRLLKKPPHTFEQTYHCLRPNARKIFSSLYFFH